MIRKEILAEMTDVIIRYREVVNTKPVYGRFGEYQVVLNRKIIARTDMLHQAERWASDRGYTVTSTLVVPGRP